MVPNHATTVELKSNGKPSAEQLEASGVYTKFKPNKIKYFDNSVIKDDFVAFRMWDKPTFTVQPNAGYYIKKVVVEAENPTDNTWKEIMDLRNLPDTPDVLGARDLTIDGVTTNIRITVDFEEKPSEKPMGLMGCLSVDNICPTGKSLPRYVICVSGSFLIQKGQCNSQWQIGLKWFA